MQDLVKQEQFELEVLDSLNSKKLLASLVFCGGTMLRLCHGLDRFSVDLDFWVVKAIDEKKLFSGLRDCLSMDYEVKDAASKFHTMLFEIRSRDYPRALKIEIRKESKKIGTEKMIAYSRYSDLQVILTVVRLDDMMKSKVEAFLGRAEARDLFDIEFLVKKGIGLNAVPADSLRKVMKKMEELNKHDYGTRLGSLLEARERLYYMKEHFKILKARIASELSSSDK